MTGLEMLSLTVMILILGVGMVFWHEKTKTLKSSGESEKNG